MQDLTITLIQSDLHWEDTTANLAMFEEKIWEIATPTDLIVLPEMFTTGFTMNAKALAEPMNLMTFKWLKQQAAQTGAVITGSYIVQEQGQYYNRLLWMQPDGQYDCYDKRHLFRMADEHQTFSAGDKRLIKEIKGWRICPLVCYDLRFPAWSRNVGNVYDLLIYVANWPQARSHAWDILLQARAIENLAYVAGVNRVKEDGKGHSYSGGSALIDFRGQPLFYQQNEEIIHTQSLSKAALIEFREKFPAFMDSDEFEIKL